MSQRNRVVCVAIALVAALVLIAPAPTFAARLPEGGLSPAGAWELAWSWFTGVVFPGHGALGSLASRWEKEGGAIDPNGTGSTNPKPPAPLQPSGGIPAGGGR